MKSIRKAFLGNQEYHHNLLGEEFDELVEEATGKTLTQPNAEANRNVILAINDPNTGMELTPQRVSQELRKHLRSTNAQKQWMTTVLIRDVLAECSSVLPSVVMEILVAVSIVASMDVALAGQAARNAKQVATETMNQYGRVGGQGLRNTAGAGSDRQRLSVASASSRQKEPERSVELIQTYEQTCKNHCEVVRGLIVGGEQERTSSLVKELLGEIKQMRRILVKAVEKLANHDGAEIEKAIVDGFEAIDATDKLFELYESAKTGKTPELTLRDMADLQRTSSRSLDLLGERTMMDADVEHRRPERRHSTDAFGLDALEDGLRQLTPPPDDDPFQSLANGTDGHHRTTQSQPNANPFCDSTFSF